MELTADQTATVEGAPPARDGGDVFVIACGAIAREILAICETNGLSHIGLHCLPAILHNTPDKIPAAVRSAIARFRKPGRRLFVGYGDCGTGGLLDAVLAEEGAERLPGPHCYAFFSGTRSFLTAAEEEFTSFYLTDFLARQFDAFVVEPLGLDRHPELVTDYFGHYEKLVYLAQTEDSGLTAMAQRAASRLGLRFERRATGYGDLSAALKAL